MALVLMGGLLLSTFLTSVLLPATALLAEDIFAAVGRVFYRGFAAPEINRFKGDLRRILDNLAQDDQDPS
jgi:hypothetical protein